MISDQRCVRRWRRLIAILRRELSDFPHESRVFERFLHDHRLSMARRESVASGCCDEQERNVSTHQNVGDIIDAAAVKIEVEKGAVEYFFVGQQLGFVQRPDRPDHFKAFDVQQIVDVRSHEELVLNHQQA